MNKFFAMNQFERKHEVELWLKGLISYITSPIEKAFNPTSMSNTIASETLRPVNPPSAQLYSKNYSKLPL